MRPRDRQNRAEPPPQPSCTDQATCLFRGPCREGLLVQQEKAAFPVAQSLQEAPSSGTLDWYNHLHRPAPVDSIFRLCASYKLSNSQGIKATAGVILRIE